jgi:hypothetical protein
MNFLNKTKDGGPESTVWAYWLIEIKSLFSVALLRFEDGSRDAYHSHALNSISWLLSGRLQERFPPSRLETMKGWPYYAVLHRPSWIPIITRRTTTHKVVSHGRSWVLSFRGPWSRHGVEKLPDGSTQTLESGRKVVQSDA